MIPDLEADLMERIAQDLPADVRAAYCRELNHCRSLPESDEMLRILRAMQCLTLLMRQVPGEVTAERVRFEVLFSQTVQDLRGFAERAAEYRAIIEDRLGLLQLVPLFSGGNVALVSLANLLFICALAPPPRRA
jgi:hypothetical protein